MNEHHQNTEGTLSINVYQRGLWALGVGCLVLLFFFVSWLSTQRAEILSAHKHSREVEEQSAVALRARDAVIQERLVRIKALDERLAKSETARFAAEKEARDIAESAVKSISPTLSAPQSQKRVATQAATLNPTAPELTAFIQMHLAHMTEAVESQMGDYAEEVDFHDKPHATIRAIENERRSWAQKFPVRVIYKDEIQPKFTALQDATHGWIVTAVFQWRWVFKSQSGSVAHGTTRDTWKIVPSPQGFKIISEHSADPATGASKD